MRENSDARVVIVEDDEQLQKIREVRARLPQLEEIVLMIGSAEDALSTADLSARGAAVDPGGGVGSVGFAQRRR